MQKQHWLFNGCFEWPHDEPEKASFMSETKRCPSLLWICNSESVKANAPDSACAQVEVFQGTRKDTSDRTEREARVSPVEKSNVNLACVSCRKPGLESKAILNHLRGHRDGTFSASPGHLVRFGARGDTQRGLVRRHVDGRPLC